MPDYETIALTLQGGGALGAYQAGVFQGLHEAGIEPNWLAGISIGALNTAIIAGNPPEKRVERLLQFWETICQPAFGLPLPALYRARVLQLERRRAQSVHGDAGARRTRRGTKGLLCAALSAAFANGRRDRLQAASYYDTAPLKATLESLCDFDRINSREMRVSVGAVNCGTGNFAYFDNTHTTLRAEHFMASGALPPGFAAVEIDGQYYWDGGLMSNTPLYEVMQTTPRRDTLAFQVDLWSAIGPVPDSITDVQGAHERHPVFEPHPSRDRHAATLATFPACAARGAGPCVAGPARRPWCKLAEDLSCSKRYNVIHLIYRQKEYEGHYKDFQFGLSTMREHWQSGLDDIRHSLSQPDWLAMPDNDAGFVTHDIHRDGR